MVLPVGGQQIVCLLPWREHGPSIEDRTINTLKQPLP
jgi:hypothetical protein